jgi:hypothetical protein
MTRPPFPALRTTPPFWRLLPLLPVLGLALAIGACGKPEVEAEPEGCVTAADCGPGEACEHGKCVPEEEPGCHPPCSGALPVCDEDRGYCKVCTATAGCGGGTPYCLPAENGGEGLCVACRGDGDCVAPAICDPVKHACVGCTDSGGCGPDAPICHDGTCVVCTEEAGCGGDAPICDLSVAGGACVVCTEEAGCGEGRVCDRAVPGGACVTCTAERGCGGDTPLCDTSVPGGECVECVGDGDCPGGRFCAAGVCLNCDATGRGCASPEPQCDVSADGGRGACVGCRSDADCMAPTPTCHPERKVCVGCASLLDCGGATPHCDPEAREGAGACVACLNDGHCGGDTPVCDGGICVACTAARGCGAGTFCADTESGPACITCTETRGCSGAAPLCDTSVPGGACVACIDDADCGDPARPLCDRARAGGRGACVACTTDHRGCGGQFPYCRTDADWGAGACRRCLEDVGCGGDTPVCDFSVAGGQCVRCSTTAGCGGATPYCDVASRTCKACLADDTGCSGALPHCDPAGAGGLGACVECTASTQCRGTTPACDPATRQCVACTATEGCGGQKPHCLVWSPPEASRCVECLEAAHCDAEVEICSQASCVNLASGSIDQVRPPPVDTTVYRATVTYLKPAVGGEPAGFFLQGEQAGPGLFVAVDPATLVPPPAVGDRVTFEVASWTTVDEMFHVTAISDWQVVSSGHPVLPMARTLTTRVPSLELYESTLALVAGTVYPFGPAENGFSMAMIDTGHGPGLGFMVRLPETLRNSLGLVPSCFVALGAVPIWRADALALPTAYRAEDVAVSCPPPFAMDSATATSPTSVTVFFNSPLDPQSVQGNGSQFTITPNLAVTGATVSTWSTLHLTTDPQVPGQTYTITVTDAVADQYGAPADPATTATFTGFAP